MLAGSNVICRQYTAMARVAFSCGYYGELGIMPLSWALRDTAAPWSAPGGSGGRCNPQLLHKGKAVEAPVCYIALSVSTRPACSCVAGVAGGRRRSSRRRYSRQVLWGFGAHGAYVKL